MFVILIYILILSFYNKGGEQFLNSFFIHILTDSIIIKINFRINLNFKTYGWCISHIYLHILNNFEGEFLFSIKMNIV